MRTLRASHNLATVGRDIYTSDCLVMTCQFVLQLKGLAGSLVQVDNVVAGYGERLAVGRKGVVRDSVVEQMMDFWGSHIDGVSFMQ